MADKTALLALNAIVRNSAIMYRKGEEVEVKNGATHIYAMPPSPEGHLLVDMHFCTVGFIEAAANRALFCAALDRALAPGQQGEFYDMTADKLSQGVSYITVGAWLGSQDLALLFMALGQHHGLWTVITPATEGVTDAADAEKMAGAGYVLTSGFKSGSADAPVSTP